MVALPVDEVAELASGAAEMPVEVAAWNCPVVARLDQQTLRGGGLLLLRNNCVDSCLGLLLLGPELGGLEGGEGLVLLEFILGFDVVDGVLDHLEELLVRHAGVVAKQVHDLFALAYKRER